MRLASKRIVTTLRVWWRATRNYFTGRRWTVPLPARQPTEMAVLRGMIRASVDDFMTRRNTNARLMTGMSVALQYGPNVSPFSGWERLKWALQYNRQHGMPRRPIGFRFVGRPIVLKSANGMTKIGLTEFHPNYEPRQEQLANRRRTKKSGLTPITTYKETP